MCCWRKREHGSGQPARGRWSVLQAVWWVAGNGGWTAVTPQACLFFNGSHKIFTPSHSYSVSLTQQRRRGWTEPRRSSSLTGTNNRLRRSSSPLTCQMLTIFSMAEAKYFPVTLQARGDKQGSLGDPSPESSEDPFLTRQSTESTQVMKLNDEAASTTSTDKLLLVYEQLSRHVLDERLWFYFFQFLLTAAPNDYILGI